MQHRGIDSAQFGRPVRVSRVSDFMADSALSSFLTAQHCRKVKCAFDGGRRAFARSGTGFEAGAVLSEE